MMVIIKARPGTIAPPEKRVGVDLPASVTVQTVVRRLRRTRQACPRSGSELGHPPTPTLSDRCDRGTG